MKNILLCLIVFFSYHLSAQVPSYVPSDGLVGYWPFDGNANDESGNGNDGTVTDAILTADRYSNANSAYNFDYAGYANGALDDMIYIAHNNSFNTSGLTVSCWFKPTAWSYPGNPGSQAVFKRVETGYSTPPGEFWYIVFTDDGTLIGGVSDDNQGGTNIVSNAGDISLNNWYNVVLTYDGQTEKLYLDGVLVGSQTGTNLLSVQGNSGLSFGVSLQANGYWRPFNGDIDDSGIWNRALSESEIQQIYSSCTTPITLNSIPDRSSCGADLVSLTASTTHTYSVDVTATSSMDFTFAGDFSGTDPVMNVSVGDTVVFNVNSPGHPFWINTLQGTGTSNGVSVTNNGTSSGVIKWVPSAVGTYYYNCQFHSMMTNTITVGAPAISYAWDNGVTNGVPFTPSTSGDYIVVATDTSGCTDTDTVSVSVLNLAIDQSDTTICLGDSLDLTVLSDSVSYADTLLFDQFTMTFGSAFNYNTPTTVNGIEYLIKVEGTFAIWSCCTSSGTGSPRLDGAFYFATDGSDTPYERILWCWNGVTPNTNTSLFRPDNDIYQNNHVYWFSFTGDGASENFCFSDNAYGDNNGSLSFEIYELPQTVVNNSILWSTGDTTPPSR